MKKDDTSKQPKEAKRAAIYARVSSDAQYEKGYSIPTQLEGCRKYAQACGFVVVADFTEDCSGTIPIPERPQGKKLYDLVNSGAIDAVIIFTHDRTARDEPVLEYLLFKAYLYERGVELHYSDTGLDPYTMEANLVGYIKAYGAAGERKKILERTSRGRRAKAASGRLVMHGSAPYGYDREGRRDLAKLVIYEPEAQVVRTIFIWYTRGDKGHGPMSLWSIANRLNQEGAPPPNHRSNSAGVWTVTLVRSLLKNEIYAGRTYYGKTHLKTHIKQPRQNWITIEVPELAIIDRELWEEAQARARRNLELAARNRKREYLLSGFFKCAGCNGAMCGGTSHTLRKNGEMRKLYLVYKCGRHWHQQGISKCPQEYRSVSAAQTEGKVWEWLTGLLENEEKLEKGLRAMEQRAESEIGPKRERLEQIKKKIMEAEVKVKRLVSAIGDEADETIAGALKHELKIHAKQIENWKAESQGIEQDLAQKRVTPELKEYIRQQARQIREKLRNPTFAQKRELFDLLGLKVVFRIDEKEQRWLDVSCGLYPQGHAIALHPSPARSYRTAAARRLEAT